MLKFIGSLMNQAPTKPSTKTYESVKLAFQLHKCENADSKINLIATHDIFNNNEFLKPLVDSEDLKKVANVYVVELRNHGNSGFSDEMSYGATTADFYDFIKINNLA